MTNKFAFKIDGQVFGFKVIAQGGSFEIYCTTRPKNPYGTDVLTTHIYGDGRLCIQTQVNTLDKAKAWCQFWGAGYAKYVRTGDKASFQKISRKVDI
jgi:hypothetical protein